MWGIADIEPYKICTFADNEPELEGPGKFKESVIFACVAAPG